MNRCEPYFANHGCIIDQPFQVRLPDGMIRCYMGADKVVGFGHQFIKALIPPPPEGPNQTRPSRARASCIRLPRGSFRAYGQKWKSEWTPQMMQLLDIDAGSLPIIWDADFSMGRATRRPGHLRALRINVSSVFPFPEQAPSEIARLAKARPSSPHTAQGRSWPKSESTEAARPLY